jgi:signal transduction histidine kinase
MRRLTEALVAAAGELMRCRDEQSVLETAVEAIHRQGFFVAVMLLEGDSLVHGPMRQDPAQVAAGELLYGRPIHEVRFPRSSLPHLEEVFARRKAAFHNDFLRTLVDFHDAELLVRMRSAHPLVRALDAPILVEEEPYGVLSVQGEALTPASAATLELFARQVGGALENVRHHRLAAARLAELSRLQAELVAQERLTVLGEAAGVVAHEVRNPLGSILNAVAVLKRDKLGPVGTSAVEMLEEEATRLDAMVRDLLDVVRPLEPRPRPLHLGELARRTLELFHERRQLGTVRVTLDEEPELPTLQADETLLQLALENLVRNAVQSSPSGGQVHVAVGSVPGGVRLTVEDEGPGVSPADAQRVFEPFFTTRTTGTGLGLAVVRRVVLAHGGTVSVGQRPGGGAHFELRLPRV